MYFFQLWNTTIHSPSNSEFLDKIQDLVTSNTKRYFVTPNPEILLQSRRNPDLKHALDNATMNPADGVGLAWANYFINILPKTNRVWTFVQVLYSSFIMFFATSRITKYFPIKGGSDWIIDILKLADQNNYKIYILGSMDDVPGKFISKYSKIYPNAIFSGYDTSIVNTINNENIIKKINLSKPNILLVALGSPKQETWIYNNLDKLDINFAIGIGAGLDFMVGNQIDAPAILKANGLKWLWRLFMSPFEKKIGSKGFIDRFKRIYKATFVFTKEVYKTKISS